MAVIANFYEAGTKFQYKATKAIAYHELIVVNDLVGVATHSAASGDIIVCDCRGVYKVPKAASEAIEQGKKVYLTSGGDVTATSTGNTYIGIAFKPAEAADATIAVAINK